MPLRPCAQRGCPHLVARGRCTEHQAAKERARHESHTWVYRDRRWFAARRRALVRAEHRCQAVEAGARCPASEGLVGHHDYRGGLVRMLADGLDPFDERWIVMLCEHHHGRVEALLRRRRKAVQGR